MKQYYVYIMSNRSRTLYVGVTNDLQRRVDEHKRKVVPGLTSKYSIAHLVYAEATSDVSAAIAREKQIKGWLRWRKLALVSGHNPQWRDLSDDWSADMEIVERSETLRFAQCDSATASLLPSPVGARQTDVHPH